MAEGAIGMDYLTPQLHRRIYIQGSDAIYDFDFAADRYEVSNAKGKRLLDLSLERNDMFMDIARDWVALLEGRQTSNPLVPRLDLVSASASFTADAWNARHFSSMISKEIS